MEAEVREKRRCYLLPPRWRKGPRIKECEQPLEAGKGKEMDSPLESPGGIQTGQHLDFNLAQ